MKLLIISRGSALCGGVESINNALCRELPKRGWDVRLGLTKGARFNDPDAYAAAYPDLPVFSVDGSRGTRQARLEALRTAIRSQLPDVILNMRVFDAYEAAARAKKEFPGLRLVAGVRCFEAPLIHDASLYREHVDAYVTSGELVARACRDWAGIETDRVTSIPGGVQPPRRDPGPRDLSKGVRLGYIGRLEQHQKRIMDLLPLLDELERQSVPFSLTIAGDGPDADGVHAALSSWVARGRVQELGRVTPEFLYERVYPKLDVLVHFAHTEGVTISPREAMVHGVVPVVSRFTGLLTEGQFRHNENALVFDVGDVATAAQHVARLASDADLFNRLSAAARTSQDGKYSYDGAVDAWEAVLCRALARPAVTGPIPCVPSAESGRLVSLVPSPWLRQRIRNTLGLRPVHEGPGGEWPTHSASLRPDKRGEIEAIARDA